MKRAMSMTIGVALAFFVAAAAHAATTSGKVVSTDAISSTVVIQTDDGKRFTFLKNDATKIAQKDVTIAFGDLKPGARVTVTSDQTPSDPAVQMIASRVQVDQMLAAAPIRTAEVDSANYDSNGARVAKHLPRTATPLPLIALSGLGSLTAGIAMRLRRRQS